MNYAVIENETVTNVIWLNEQNASEFPSAVNVSDRPASIGDTYENGRFYRGGEEIPTVAEQLADALAALETLGYTEGKV